jgi:hypothetical protein
LTIGGTCGKVARWLNTACFRNSWATAELAVFGVLYATFISLRPATAVVGQLSQFCGIIAR